jgi:uncharacterized protein YdeI (BOF family)
MKKYTILLFFALIIIVGKAQVQINLVSPNGYTPTLFEREDALKMPLSLGKERFLGNDSLFIQGELVTKKRHYKTELVYRFDQIERALEVEFESGKRIYIEEKDIVLFKLFFEDNTAVFIPLKLPKDEKRTLVQIIYKTPTLQLYRDVHKTVNRVVEKYWGEPIFTDEAKNNYHYYFRKTDKDALVEVDMKAKSFVKVLPKKKEKIERLFEKEEEDGKLTVSKICKIMKALDVKAE